MIMYIAVCFTALGVSFLTLFSGFGLSTMLMPIMALFFPVEIAVAMTAIIHIANNLFKLGMFWKYTDRDVVIRFAVPGMVAALAGAWLLTWISSVRTLFDYQLGGHVFHITFVKIVIGILMIVFALFELVPRLEKIQFERKFLPIGGLISGFLGGLSGQQGAMRSAFLSKTGLTKEAFIATGIVIAVLIDITRISVYAVYFQNRLIASNWLLIVSAIFAAVIGALVGAKFMKRITLKTVQYIVGVMLIILGIFMCAGVI